MEYLRPIRRILIGALTLALLLAWPRLKTGFPAPLVGIVVATVIAWWLSRSVEGFQVATIASRLSANCGLWGSSWDSIIGIAQSSSLSTSGI